MMSHGCVCVTSIAMGLAGCVDAVDHPSFGANNESAVEQDLVDRSDYALVGLGGKCMTKWGDGSDDGTPVILWDCDGGESQRWHWSGSSTNGQFIAYGKCLDIPGAGFYDRNQLQLWDCNGTVAQKFDMFESTFDGLEHLDSIRPAANHGFCVEVAGGFTANGTPVQLFDCNGTVSQQWYAVSADQNPSAPPPPAHIEFVETSTPSVALTDTSLFETSFTWYRRMYGDGTPVWQAFTIRPALSGVGGSDTIARPAEYSDRQYEYKVVAANAAGTSDSNIISVGPPPPAAPSNLHVTAVTATSISIAWNENSNNVNFIVYPTSIQGQTTAQTSITFTGLPVQTTICFVVTAYGNTGESPESNRVCATTANAPPHYWNAELAKSTTNPVYWASQIPIAGTVTQIHVPPQDNVTGVYLVKPGYFGSVECGNLASPHLVYTPVGTDVNLTTYFSDGSQAVSSPTFVTCDLFSQLTDKPFTELDITYY